MTKAQAASPEETTKVVSVQNISDRPLYFGSLCVLPGQTQEVDEIYIPGLRIYEKGSSSKTKKPICIIGKNTREVKKGKLLSGYELKEGVDPNDLRVAIRALKDANAEKDEVKVLAAQQMIDSLTVARN